MDITKCESVKLDDELVWLGTKEHAITIAKHFAKSMTSSDLNEIIIEYNRPDQKVSENWADFMAEIIPKIYDTERQSENTYTAVSDKINLTPKQLKGAIKSIGSPGVVFVKQEPTYPQSYEVGKLRETLASAYIELSGKTNHASDCATSNSPVMIPGRCDCTYNSEIGEIQTNELFNKEDDLHG